MKKQLIWEWIAIVGIVIISTTLFYTELIAIEHHALWKVFGAHFIYTLYLWKLNLWILKRIRLKYPRLEQTRQRIVLKLWLYPLVVAVEIWIGTGIYDVTRIWGKDLVFSDYFYDYAVSITFTLMVVAAYEIAYLFSQWKKTTLESEELKRQNIQSQLDSLKNQVNPHFLFNSLNSLSSLIEDDGKQAQIFIEELSRVYRYLLQSNENELTTLQKELEFIEAYFFLLKTRFGEGIELKIHVEQYFYTWQIPSLTLQLLVENAVKHNIVSNSKPLKIEIFTEGERNLVVSNNIQQKHAQVASNHTGLSNITSKFRLMSQPEVVINKTEQHFTVILPLIKST